MMKFTTDTWGNDIIVQWTEEYPNGYGVSVIVSPYSYGGRSGDFEVAVTHHGEICYLSGLTDDVFGYLNFAGVADIIDRVKALPVDFEHVHN